MKLWDIGRTNSTDGPSNAAGSIMPDRAPSAVPGVEMLRRLRVSSVSKQGRRDARRQFDDRRRDLSRRRRMPTAHRSMAMKSFRTEEPVKSFFPEQ